MHWKGAAEIVLSSCKSWLSVDGSVQPMSAEKVISSPNLFVGYSETHLNFEVLVSVRLTWTFNHLQHDEYKKLIEHMAVNSLRCVAFAYCASDIEMIPKEDIVNWKLPEDDLTLLGIVGIKVGYCYHVDSCVCV